MDPVMKRRLDKLFTDRKYLVGQVRDKSLPLQQRKNAHTVLGQVDATIDIVMARVELTDYSNRMAAARPVAQRPRKKKLNPVVDVLGTAALVYLGSRALKHWKK